jgi:bifunctional non-homologous end joining protein LigD
MVAHQAQDKYATTDDITEKDKSVQSGKTIEKIAASSKKTWSSNRKSKETSAKKSVPKKAAAKRSSPRNLQKKSKRRAKRNS